MAYIYKITNVVNGKCYIGKTEFEPQKRFNEHLQDSAKTRGENRPLYRAINKYGPNNFTFEVIEETLEPENREIYWIQYFSSYSNGYNATLGGDGRKYLDHDKILKDYLELQSMSETARQNNCSVDTVKNILSYNNIERKSSEEVNSTLGKKVAMLDKNTKEVLASFNSQSEAARFIQEHKYSNITLISGIVTKIGDVCKGKRKTFAGFSWKYL